MSSELITILEKEAAGEIDRILGEARVQAERVVAEATRQAQEYLAAQRQQLEAERQAAKVRALSAAQVRASALVLQAKDEALHEVLSVAEEELARVQQDKARYGPILRGLIREASGALSGRMTVEANPKDLDLAKQAVRDLKLDAEVKAADDVSGGVRLIADDSRFIVENTLASRVERVKTLLAPEIATLLWG
ncbi:MAG: V-type ATP synthase subunit E [Bacillati bacterium ANGP1]|uniref:V-type proton ATPase subunit E n=1 Tax=Candidatus Segetimicrobium genomatis TaxID=2569760 RepID=A0A537LNT6_9BACT|nr:MAG: V-type ATP synthase subunit E [Terrabacteria group bacterium ANGP1]